MTELERWAAAAGAALELEPGAVDPDLVLDLARDVAHEVVRPAAPVTTYLLGVAVGGGADPARAAATLAELARDWQTDDRH